MSQSLKLLYENVAFEKQAKLMSKAETGTKTWNISSFSVKIRIFYRTFLLVETAISKQWLFSQKLSFRTELMCRTNHVLFSPDETFLLKASFFSNVVIFERFNSNLVYTQSLRSVLTRSYFWLKQRKRCEVRTQGNTFTFRNISHLDSIHQQNRDETVCTISC